MIENKKIDILNDVNQIVYENYDTGNRVFYAITELTNDEFLFYNSFMDLVKVKTDEPFNHIFLGNEPIKRFVNISSKLQEILYDDLIESEKEIFDNFFNKFTN